MIEIKTLIQIAFLPVAVLAFAALYWIWKKLDASQSQRNSEDMGSFRSIYRRISLVLVAAVAGMEVVGVMVGICVLPAPQIYEAEGNVHQNEDIAAVARFEIKPPLNWYWLFDIYYTLDGTDPKTSHTAMKYDPNLGLALNEGEGGAITAKTKYLFLWSDPARESKRIFDPKKTDGYIDLEAITINRENFLTLEVGEELSIQAIPVPINASEKKFFWESDNPVVAGVNGVDTLGTVSANSAGTATITVKSVYDDTIRKEFLVLVIDSHSEPTQSDEMQNENDSQSSTRPGSNKPDEQDSTLPNVSVENVTSISIRSGPSKVSYYVGDMLDTSGLEIIAKYSNGTQKSITSGFSCNPDVFSNSGVQKVVVTYDGVSTSFEVIVKQVELTSISVKTTPTKLEYFKGEALETTGMKLTAIYNNNKTEIIDVGFSCTPTKLYVVGQQKITVKYGGKSTSFTVNVLEPITDENACGDNLAWRISADGKLIIMGNGEMYDYSRGTAPWYDLRNSITEVVLPNGLLTIGMSAFEDCAALSTIALPEGLTSIGADAFCNCSSLRGITIPDSVIDLEAGAFQCSGLINITIPKSVIRMGNHILNSCTELETVVMLCRISEIPESTFWGCEKLQQVSLPDTIVTIGEKAFYHCSNLESFDISENVSTIKANAFAKCNKLSSIVLPVSVEKIAGFAFYSCEGLQSVRVMNSNCEIDALQYTLGVAGTTRIYGYTNSTAQAYARNNGFEFIPLDPDKYEDPINSGTCGDNLSWTYSDGVLNITGSGDMYDYEYGTSPWASYRLNITSVSLPQGLTRIGNSAFNSCENLESVTIPDSVRAIGEYAFVQCSKVNVSLPANVNSIGKNAFASTDLRDVTIPYGTTTIAAGSFMFCERLVNVSIADSVTNINMGAFLGCTNLTTVTIPESVVSIDGQAFENCDSLKSIYIMNADCKISHVGGIGQKDVITIFGYEGSTAQEFAQQNGYQFKVIS